MESITTKRINEVKGTMSQSEFAKSINSSQPVICKILNGEQPSLNVLIDISKQYHVSVDWLLGLSPYKNVSGFSQFDNNDPVSYGDVIAFFIALLKCNTVSFSRNITDEKSIYGADNKKLDTITVNDHIVGDLLFSANTILSSSPETIDSWKNKVLDDYYIPLEKWGHREECVYSARRGEHSSLEILRELIGE